jgi:hypothetical protein
VLLNRRLSRCWIKSIHAFGHAVEAASSSPEHLQSLSTHITMCMHPVSLPMLNSEVDMVEISRVSSQTCRRQSAIYCVRKEVPERRKVKVKDDAPSRWRIPYLFNIGIVPRGVNFTQNLNLGSFHGAK